MVVSGGWGVGRGETEVLVKEYKASFIQDE